MIKDDNSNILIAIPTYKEAENILELIKKIKNENLKVKILIINDYSEDNTKEIIENLKDPNIFLIERPKKLGLGTAHKLSFFYAIKFNFDYLITMDADLSHDPEHLKQLIAMAGKNNFVIGSRFCKGGKSEYKGLRKIISICGNFFAKKILSISINEITTYYRVYSINHLKQLPYDELNAQGYSLGVKIVWLMKKLNANLIEIPIHFKDRNFGKSKIPKLQIFISFFDLIYIKFKDIFGHQKFYQNNKTLNLDLKCKFCENNFLSLKKKFFQCLVCGEIKNEKY